MEEEKNLDPNYESSTPSESIDSNLTNNNAYTKKYNNFFIWWCVILSILVLFLLIIQFVPTKKISAPVSTGYVNGKIAHINIDTIMTKYPLVDTLQNRLQRQITSLETDLINRQSRLQKNMEAYQKDIQAGKIITKDEAGRREEQLVKEQQQLMSIRDQYDIQIQNLQMTMQSEILDSIKNAIKYLPAELEFDYVLGYSHEGAIFYANPSLDITNEVLKILNKRLKK